MRMLANIIKYFVLLLLLGSSISLKAQTKDSTFTISGKIIDYKNNVLDFATISLFNKDQLIKKVHTSRIGEYIFDSIPKGYYDLKVTYVGYITKEILGVFVNSNLTFDLKMIKKPKNDSQKIIRTICMPLLNRYQPNQTIISKERIRHMGLN